MILRKTKNGIWFVRYKTSFGWRKMSTRQTDRDAAIEVVRIAGIAQIEQLACGGVLQAGAIMQAVNGKSMSGADAFREWASWLAATSPSPQTVKRYMVCVRKFLGHLGWPPLSVITTQQIDAWVNDPSSNAHRQTRIVALSAINNLFKYSANNGWSHNPAGNVHVKLHLLSHEQKESKHRQPFTQEQFERLIEAARTDPFWYPALMIARYTGLRWGDVVKLEWGSFMGDHLIVWTDKRDRRVQIPLAPELIPVFNELEETRSYRGENKYVLPPAFPSETQAGWDPSWRQGGWMRLLEKSGLKGSGLVLHSLRHAYATELSKSGLPVKEIARRMAHMSEATTLRYIHTLMYE